MENLISMKMNNLKVNSNDCEGTLKCHTTRNIGCSPDTSGVIGMVEKNLKKLPSLTEEDEKCFRKTNGAYHLGRCELHCEINGDKVHKSTFGNYKNIAEDEMEVVKKHLTNMKTDRRVSLRSLLIEISLKDNVKYSFLQNMLDTQDKSVMEDFLAHFKEDFNLAVRVPGDDILLSLPPKGGRNCSCTNCLEGCPPKNCLKMGDKGSVPKKEEGILEKKIQDELEYFVNEIDQRGDSNVAFIDVCNQYLIDKRITSCLYTMLYNGTNEEYLYCVKMLSKEFNLTWNGCDGLTLSMRDLDFGCEALIEKPCSLAHEKEIEDGLEAVVAGGDILCEDGTTNYYNCKKVLDSNVINTSGEDEKSMSITEMLVDKAGFENGDALEQFICSRIESYISETGYDRIPVNELDSVINNFFEMHVDPIREFGMGWPEMCQRWVDKKYLYFSKDKTAIMVTDPETPELYLEDRDKIFADNQEDNERIIDELAMHGINLRPYVLFRNGQPHIIIEDASVENKSK
uniref:DNA-directed RNA polymerase n=1 Tax=Strongyloides venezuelensis TaxID=75913 RepID=A0A0K0G3N5_STRVS